MVSCLLRNATSGSSSVNYIFVLIKNGLKLVSFSSYMLLRCEYTMSPITCLFFVFKKLKSCFRFIVVEMLSVCPPRRNATVSSIVRTVLMRKIVRILLILPKTSLTQHFVDWISLHVIIVILSVSVWSRCATDIRIASTVLTNWIALVIFYLNLFRSLTTRTSPCSVYYFFRNCQLYFR